MEYLIIWLLFGIVAAIIAGKKARSGCGWFMLGCLFGPFALVVALLPSIKTDPNTPTAETHVKCPDCAELVLSEARVCKHCGCKLIPVAQQPDASDKTAMSYQIGRTIGKMRK